MRHTIKDIHDYLTYTWYDSSELNDFNMAIDSGFTEYAAYLLHSAGAIDSSTCYDDSKPIQRSIERLLKKYTKKQLNKDLDECFGNAIVYVNPDTNEHAFIKNDYVDYLMDDNDMKQMGYLLNT